MTDKNGNKWLRISEAISAIHKDKDLRIQSEAAASLFLKALAAIYPDAESAVFMIEDDGTNVLVESGSGGPSLRPYFSESMPLMLFLKGSISVIHCGKRSDIPPEAILYDGQDISSAICCPYADSNGPRGFVYLCSRDEDAFGIDDLRLAELAASWMSMLLDVESLKDQVDALAIMDSLTGCLNNKKFQEDIDIDIPCAERYGKALSIVKLDVDFLKSYNDSNGREMGDAVLRKIGQTLAYSIRKCDKLYRYSGDEFVITLPGIDKERAVFTANRLQKVLGQLRFEGEESVKPRGRITFSIGVASFPSDSVYKDGLIRTVDAALRKAKDSGGDTVVSSV